MKAQSDGLGDLLRKLFESYPQKITSFENEDFLIPTQRECEVSSEIEAGMPFSQEMIEAVRGTLSLHEAYDLRTFSVRIAIFAARTYTPELLKVSALCLMIASRVDWRDLLIALSLMRACANDLGVNPEYILQQAAEYATPDRKEIVLDGFLGRNPEMQGPDVMGYNVSGTGETLTFTKRIWS